MYVSHTLEVYFLLFVDALVASLILPLSRLTAFNIMCCFGGYNAIASVAVGTLGASVGGSINWFLGKLIYLARMGYHKQKAPYILPMYTHVALILLLGFLSWVHIVGALINVLCGYFRVRLRYTFLAVFLSYCGHFVAHMVNYSCFFSY